MPAAVAGKIERRLGVTKEQMALVKAPASAPLGRLPTDHEIEEITRAFTGWKDPGKKPEAATAVQLWGLVSMGFAPHHINILGNKAYINVDGMIAHAQALIRSEGRQWGRIVYDVATEKERQLTGCRPDDICTKATYQERVPVKRTHPDGIIEETVDWSDVQSEFGRGNATNTVVKMVSARGTTDQPVEKLMPGEMARARATRRVLRVVAPTRMPVGVGMMVEGLAVDEDVPEGTLAELPAPDSARDAIEEARNEAMAGFVQHRVVREPSAPDEDRPPHTRDGPRENVQENVHKSATSAQNSRDSATDEAPTPRDSDHEKIRDDVHVDTETGEIADELTPRPDADGTHPDFAEVLAKMSEAGVPRSRTQAFTWTLADGTELRGATAIIELLKIGHGVIDITAAIHAQVGEQKQDEQARLPG